FSAPRRRLLRSLRNVGTWKPGHRRVRIRWRMTMHASTQRFSRQTALVPTDRLAGVPVTVVGVGAIGRQVALQLAAVGVRRLQLVDFDLVEATNVTTQGYARRDVGRLKVEATSEAALAIDPSMEVRTVADRF